MNKERATELIGAIIDNLCVSEHSVTVIKYLLYIGFTEEECTEYFPRGDVSVASAELKESDECVSPIFV